MDTRNYSISELLELAYNTTDQKVFKILSSFENMFVRRAVARNINTPSKIVNQLANDPVQNVSFMALQHRNCTINREICNLNLHQCVICIKDERSMDCSGCNL
jgi:hypothetical protein